VDGNRAHCTSPIRRLRTRSQPAVHPKGGRVVALHPSQVRGAWKDVPFTKVLWGPRRKKPCSGGAETRAEQSRKLGELEVGTGSSIASCKTPAERASNFIRPNHRRCRERGGGRTENGRALEKPWTVDGPHLPRTETKTPQPTLDCAQVEVSLLSGLAWWEGTWSSIEDV
jgi:hypothetical protein